MFEYVRCRYCDSAVSIDQIEPLYTESKEIGTYFYYTCPACGFTTKSLMFKMEEEYTDGDI